MNTTLGRRAVSEFLSITLLLAVVVGSGIMGQRLDQGNEAIALLANSLATGAGLVALILTFGDLSSHMNPVVTMAAVLDRSLPRREAALYVLAQAAGACCGVVLAHAIFGQSLLQHGTHIRSGPALLLSEFVATFGLLMVVLSCSRVRPAAVPYAVGAYITAAYWFTSSTSFANPAVTLARCLTDTFASIRPADVLPFIVAQVLGALAAIGVQQWLFQSSAPVSSTTSQEEVMVSNT
ncbi:aquaporin family protein [Terriglobus albidus]|uniref:Aquaporin family protein n=1 Tax=Terriglobus albidus TaxID=1592106 RepID=A0A5B9E688_9BACT|nr:MIP/aquaporin family protein [Terriglobus albidus]QEE27782.1 aquaporin family protein [Terriglobus albidus]